MKFKSIERTLDDNETFVGEEDNKVRRAHTSQVAHIQNDLAHDITLVDPVKEVVRGEIGRYVFEQMRDEKERVGDGQSEHVEFGRRERVVDLHARSIAVAETHAGVFVLLARVRCWLRLEQVDGEHVCHETDDYYY